MTAVTTFSLTVDVGGKSESVAISSASAQSSVITSLGAVGVLYALVTPSVECFFRQGSNPTALSDGTDIILLANNTYRIAGITSGNKLAFVTTAASGTVYITPNA